VKTANVRGFEEEKNVELVRWGNIAFYVSPTAVRGVKDIAISAKCETEESTVDGEKFVQFKNSGAYEITLTAVLDARLGEDVQDTANALTAAAHRGDTGYFYTGSSKLLTSQFMLVEVKIDHIEMLPSGLWLRCEAAMTLKQCSKLDGGTTSAAEETVEASGGGGSGSNKVSVKTNPIQKLPENAGSGHLLTVEENEQRKAEKGVVTPDVTSAAGGMIVNPADEFKAYAASASVSSVVNAAKKASAAVSSVVSKAGNTASKTSSGSSQSTGTIASKITKVTSSVVKK